jgi:hypothetical protein
VYLQKGAAALRIMTPMLTLSCTPHLLQDAKDAIVEAATAGALDRRLAALERRV